MTTESIDESLSPENMGVCDLCGQQINLDAGDQLDVIQFTDEDLPDDITVEEAAQSMAEALRYGDEKYDELASLAYEKFYGIKAHERCVEETSLSEWFEEVDNA